jgi:transcriptional regulator with XRE-family HTH domain
MWKQAGWAEKPDADFTNIEKELDPDGSAMMRHSREIRPGPKELVMAKKKAGTLVPIGKKIKKIRTGAKLTLEWLANETGLSIDYLKKLEAGKMIPPVGTLLQVARALKIDSSFLLKEQEEKLSDRASAYTKRTDNYAYKTLTPGAENKHLKAFQVKIDSMQDHEGVGYHHEGEEFVYVLKGTVEIKVGDHINTLGTNESLHFNSGIQHNLRNVGKDEAELLVVIYGP